MVKKVKLSHTHTHTHQTRNHLHLTLAGHGLYTQFTRPFPSLAEVGWACETNLTLASSAADECGQICLALCRTSRLIF